MQAGRRRGIDNFGAVGVCIAVTCVLLALSALYARLNDPLPQDLPSSRDGSHHAPLLLRPVGPTPAELDLRLSRLEEVTSRLRGTGGTQALADLQHETWQLREDYTELQEEVRRLQARLQGSGASPRHSGAADAVAVPRRGGGAELSPAIAGIECPAPTPMMHIELPLEQLPRGKRTEVAEKYDRRASNCNINGLWSSVTREDHHEIMKRISSLIAVRKGMLVFDWGCGCGHKLDWLAREHQTSGLGVDISGKSLLYAEQNTSRANKYCHAEGSDLEFVPDNTFDAVFSFGSVFHLFNDTRICHTYKEMVRIAKKGAKVYNGWTAEDEWPNAALYHCLRNTDVEKIEVLKESHGIFVGIPSFPTKRRGYGNASAPLLECSNLFCLD